MRHQGRVTEWRDEQGFGFITPNGGGERIFLHIKAFKPGSRRPAVGHLVDFERGVDDKGRPLAGNARYAAVRSNPSPMHSRRLPALPIALSFLAALAGLAYFGRLPVAVPLAYAGMSLVTYIAYAIDKSAAQRGRWRTQESTLQMLALLGGWPGALVAQQRLRHKSAKASFRFVFWVTVAINLAAIGWMLTPSGPLAGA